MSKPFFSKENLHSALWALLIAFVGFIGALIWKGFSGPDKVIVTKDENYQAIDTTITIIKFEGDSAILEAIRNYNHQLTIDSKKESTNKNIAVISRPKLSMPDIVEGYIKKPINSFASIDVPRKTYTRNEFIEVHLNVFNELTLDKISPVFIEIVKETGVNAVSLIWEEQFKLEHMNNSIRFSSDIKKGEYLLTIGFYLMDELHQKYPPQYSKTYKIKII